MKTIDDLIGKQGGFRKFLKEKEAVLRAMEEDRKNRILGINAPRNPILAKYSTSELLSMCA